MMKDGYKSAHRSVRTRACNKYNDKVLACCSGVYIGTIRICSGIATDKY